MSKPTPRPWEHFIEVDVSYNSRTGEKIESRHHWVRGPDKANVAIAARFFQHGEFNSKETEANAAHIVKCVNMHDELVATLKEAVALVGSLPACGLGVAETYDQWKSLLAKAEAE